MDEQLEKLIQSLIRGPSGGVIRNIGPHIPGPTRDSIFAALGVPENDPEAKLLMGTAYGQFSPAGDRTIALDLFLPSNEAPSILAHEMAHEEFTADATGGQVDKQTLGLRNVLMGRMRDANEVQRRTLLAEYYGGSNVDILEQEFEAEEPGSFSKLLERVMAPENVQKPETQEVLAATVQRGFNLARAANQHSREEMSNIIDIVDERMPGTREAFNFFIRRFPGEGR